MGEKLNIYLWIDLKCLYFWNFQMCHLLFTSVIELTFLDYEIIFVS